MIEQVEACSWVLVGDLDEIAKEEGRKKAEENLTDRQGFALAEVRDAWDQDHHEMESGWLAERLPAEYTGKDKKTRERKARENLDQLHRKSLVDKRTIGAAGAKRNLYRPWGADLSEAKLRLSVCPNDDCGSEPCSGRLCLTTAGVVPRLTAAVVTGLFRSGLRS